MDVAYGVRWRDADGERDGRLTVGDDALRLAPLRGECITVRELPFDEIRAVALGASPGDRHPALAFESSGHGTVTIESGVGRWIVGDLLTKTLTHLLAGLPTGHRALVVIRTKPEQRTRVAELLTEGPPFTSSSLHVTRYDVFTAEDELLLVFETDTDHELEDVPPGSWRWSESWREVIDEVRIAECVYSRVEADAGLRLAGTAGLGY